MKRLANFFSSVIYVIKSKSHSVFTRKPRHLWGWIIALGCLISAGYYQFSSSDSLAASGYYIKTPKVATAATRYYKPYVSSLGTDINYSSQFTNLSNDRHLFSNTKKVVQAKGEYTASLILDKKYDSVVQPKPMSLQDFTREANDIVHVANLRTFFDQSLPQSLLGNSKWYTRGLLEETQATIDTLEGTIRSVGLKPEQVLRQAARAQGQGGIDQLVAMDTADIFEKGQDSQEKIQLTLEKKELLEKAIQSFPLIAPVKKFRFTSGFGARRDPFHRRLRRHNGVDLAAPKGTPIFSPSHGKVVAVGRLGGYGRVVKVDHGFGIETFYAHLSKALVKKGDIVKPHQTIALMGSTGRSTGSHLHYEIRVNGKVWDPQTFIEAGSKLLALKKEQTLPFTKVHNF